MDYFLNIRAFFDTTSHSKAIRFAAQTFPRLPICVQGPYWKDESLMEATLNQRIVYADDKTALWDTMNYFTTITDQWCFQGPYAEPHETIFSGIVSARCAQHMTWCSMELLRANAGENNKRE